MKWKRLPLTRGKFAIVDALDFLWVSQWKWTFHSEGYAYRRRRNDEPLGPKTIFLHRAVLRFGSDDPDVDHRSRNRLDCRRSNLRIASKATNGMNRGKQTNNRSGFKGVCWDPARRKWKAQITIRQRNYFLGRFDTAETAARVYDRAAKRLFGAFAWLNFAEGR
jgi:hypothetical protein